VSDRPEVRPVPPLVHASARKRAYAADGTDDGTSTQGGAPGRGQRAARSRARPRTGTLGGSNKMLSAREVAAILSVPERTIREKWRAWGLPAYRIGKHLRWKEREVHAWIDRHAA
jgi:excisionase family DNA binding protein